MSIVYLFAAFSCGVLACTMGACQSFVLAGLVGIAGMGVASAMNAAALANPDIASLLFSSVASGDSDVMSAVLSNLGPVIGNLSFDVLFAPAIAFVAPIWAATYAKKRGYIKPERLAESQSWLPLLEPFRKVDVLLAGGVGGMIGAVINWCVTSFLGIGIDGHAVSVFVTCIVCKALAGEGFVSPIPKEKRVNGNRFMPTQEQGWMGHLNSAALRYTIAVFCGACFGYAEYILMLNPITFSFAHTIGFLIGAVGLMFLMMNFSIQVLPPITASACYLVKGMVIAMGNTPEAVAQISPMTFMIWGAAGGCIGITACHVLIQLFKAFSNVYIDPPACGIIVTSFVGLTIIVSAPTLASSLVFPVMVILICVAYAFGEHMIFSPRLKTVNAQT